MNYGCHLPVYGPAATREVLLGFARRSAAAYLRPLTGSHATFGGVVGARVPRVRYGAGASAGR